MGEKLNNHAAPNVAGPDDSPNTIRYVAFNKIPESPASPAHAAKISPTRLAAVLAVRAGSLSPYKIAVAVSKRERHIAKWVEAGTGIYGPRHKPIRPRKAKAFRLPGGHEARSVRGQRPQRPFERTAPALQAAERAMTQAAGRVIDQAVREANHGP